MFKEDAIKFTLAAIGGWLFLVAIICLFCFIDKGSEPEDLVEPERYTEVNALVIDKYTNSELIEDDSKVTKKYYIKVQYEIENEEKIENIEIGKSLFDNYEINQYYKIKIKE